MLTTRSVFCPHHPTTFTTRRKREPTLQSSCRTMRPASRRWQSKAAPKALQTFHSVWLLFLTKGVLVLEAAVQHSKGLLGDGVIVPHPGGSGSIPGLAKPARLANCWQLSNLKSFQLDIAMATRPLGTQAKKEPYQEQHCCSCMLSGCASKHNKAAKGN